MLHALMCSLYRRFLSQRALASQPSVLKCKPREYTGSAGKVSFMLPPLSSQTTIGPQPKVRPWHRFSAASTALGKLKVQSPGPALRVVLKLPAIEWEFLSDLPPRWFLQHDVSPGP